MRSLISRRRFIKQGGSATLTAAALAKAPVFDDRPTQQMRAALRQINVAAHPRLHLRTEQWIALRALIASNPLLGAWFDRVRAAAEQALHRPVAGYVLKGPRLLYQSRAALETITTLAGVYRLAGDVRMADRAREELRAICTFPSWHPPHFLDVAEMTNAAATGYDWLYDVLPEEEQRTIRTAILEFGIRPGLMQYRANVNWSQPFANNWGQVCAGGLILGALAIAKDDEGHRSEIEELLTFTTTKVRNAMLNYAPDGGWPEGPVYWAYATHYTCLMLSAMESALGTDLGIGRQPGFDQTGNFRMDSLGPAFRTFNYADADDHITTAPEMLWLGHRFGRADYAAHERNVLQHLSPRLFHLVWADPQQLTAAPPAAPTDRRYSRINVAFLRSSWNDSNAFYIGVKGGDNAASHSHLDLGSFVLDALGERWALDLGPDDYDLPGYFGPQRYSYYRLRTEGHNTLMPANADNQPFTAKASVDGFSTSASQGHAVIDMTVALSGAVQHAERVATLDRLPQPRFTLEDRVRIGEARLFRWVMHTAATVELRGGDAVLRQNGKALRLRIEVPQNAIFSLPQQTSKPPIGSPAGIAVLAIVWQAPEGESALRVSMAAEHAGEITGS